jgi:hypothetical protein
MRVSIVHLSDMHIQRDDDSILGRAKQIADASKNVDYEPDAVLILVTGDIAYSGREDQYYPAMLDDLSKALEHSTPIARENIFTILVPGNHDCNFSVPNSIREVLLNSIPEDSEQARDERTVRLCTEIQSEFFQALGEMEPSPRRAGTEEFSIDLCYEYRIAIAQEEVRVICCNTAWLSRLREVPGAAGPAAAAGTQSFTDQRGELELPGSDRLVRYLKPSLAEELGDIAEAEFVAEPPQDGQQDDVDGELDIVKRRTGALAPPWGYRRVLVSFVPAPLQRAFACCGRSVMGQVMGGSLSRLRQGYSIRALRSDRTS